MPKIIVTSRYLKSGSKKNLSNYVKYIATRPGSVGNSSNVESQSVTENQKQFIEKLLKDFPEGKDMFEYDDYIKKPSMASASKLIGEIFERNYDRIANRENYVGYLGQRPGVVKIGEHGLFSQEDNPIDLKAVAKEIANHKGTVWTHVVSLRRDNAEQTGYTDLNSWRELVKRNIPVIAKASKIDPNKLKWYAAFHDKESNPHVHIIVYSSDPRQGFLTKDGIEKIRSAFANDIYHDELYNLYGRQTALRNDLKKESAKMMHQLAAKISAGDSSTEELKESILSLSQQLQNYRGRKYYKFLPPEMKANVDSIFSQLAENESIQKMYALWCEMEQQKHDIYSSAKVEFPPMVDNPAFYSVKNKIINAVSEMDFLQIEPANFIPPEPSDDDSGDDFSNEIILEPAPILDDFMDSGEVIEVKELHYYLKWSKDYKAACKLIYDKNSRKDEYLKAEKLLLSEAGKGNVLALYDLGKLYTTDKVGGKDDAKSDQYYAEALKGLMEIEPNAKCLYPFEPKHPWQRVKPKDMRAYVWYRIGKMHCYGLGTEKNEAEAFKWFEKSAEAGNKYAQFSLGNMYYYGSGVQQSYDKAFSWYKASASQGQPYAQYAVAQMYANGESVVKDDTEAQAYFTQALAGFLKLEANDQADDNLFNKLGRMYMNGLGTEKDTEKAFDYFKRSAELNNKNALYEYGKALLLGENTEQDIPQGLDMIQKAVALGNSNGKRFLALEYISGEHIEQDIDRGIKMLTELADSGDSFSAYKLGKIYLSGEIVFKDLDRAEKYFRQASDDNNEFAMYSLAKLYLSDEKKDLSKAVTLLEKVCDNEKLKPFAAYTYAKILLDDNEYHDTPKAIKLLEGPADENSWCSFLLGKLYLFGNDDIESNKEEAIKWLTKSAEAGNEYAEALIQHSEDYEQAMLTNSIFGLFVSLSRMIEDDYSRSQYKMQFKVDRKTRQTIQRKKEELGQKDEIQM